MLEASPLKQQESIPQFTTRDSEGNPVSREMLLGTKFLLFFYPRDSTPGCTVEACGFRDNYKFFQKKDIQIFGISGDSIHSHEKFKRKYGFPFPLLLDENNQIAKDFGVWGKKQFMGRVFEGIHRTSFLINENGIIEKAYLKVKAKTHPTDLVEELNRND